MDIKLVRTKKLPDRTLGELYVDGSFFTNTIEDQDRGLSDNMDLDTIKRNKVYAETAIPYGTYKVKMTYSPKFKKKMPLLLDVKGFDGIRIHKGTSPLHSAGCILIPDKTKLEELYSLISKEDTTIQVI